jgi:hypothetical protein
MLGHASATMTMDTYGHLFDNRLDEVADALDRARAQSELDDELWTDTVDKAKCCCPVLPERCPKGE